MLSPAASVATLPTGRQDLMTRSVARRVAAGSTLALAQLFHNLGSSGSRDGWTDDGQQWMFSGGVGTSGRSLHGVCLIQSEIRGRRDSFIGRSPRIGIARCGGQIESRVKIRRPHYDFNLPGVRSELRRNPLLQVPAETGPLGSRRPD